MGVVPILVELHKSNTFLVPLLLFSVALLLLKLKLTPKSSSKYPPSPPGLPLIGNLHQIGSLPYRSLRALAQKHGPLMLLKLGHVPTLVISSAELVREMFKSYDTVISERPITAAGNIMQYGCTDLGFCPYGEHWRQLRRICVQEMLSPKRVQYFQYAREESMEVMVDKIRQAAVSDQRSSVDLSSLLLGTIGNAILRAVLGEKCEGENNRKKKLEELTRKFMLLFGSFSFGDLIPYLRWMDVGSGLIWRMKATSKAYDALLDEIIEEHRLSSESDEVKHSERKDLLHFVLQLQKDGMVGFDLTQDNLKSILLDMITGGIDSTQTTLEWAMAELMKNPSKMKKVQEEVRRVVGKKSKVEMSDVNQMKYLKHVIKEVLRLHPPAPIPLPRETSASIVLGGYQVPPRVRVYVNAWAIQRDPTLWDRAEEFLPERFENDPVDYSGQDSKYTPFGAGRRGCPGTAFAVTSSEFGLANLLYWFNWDFCDGDSVENLDMTEVYGITVNRKFPLQLVPNLYNP